MERAGTIQGQRRLGLSLRFMLLASLLMLIAVVDAAPYVASSFSIMTRGLSQMHNEAPVRHRLFTSAHLRYY